MIGREVPSLKKTAFQFLLPFFFFFFFSLPSVSLPLCHTHRGKREEKNMPCENNETDRDAISFFLE
jgi:hypothetical protein